jgi:hypothetical protein
MRRDRLVSMYIHAWFGCVLQGALMVNDEELLQGFSRCRELGALPMVSCLRSRYTPHLGHCFIEKPRCCFAQHPGEWRTTRCGWCIVAVQNVSERCTAAGVCVPRCMRRMVKGWH